MVSGQGGLCLTMPGVFRPPASRTVHRECQLCKLAGWGRLKLQSAGQSPVLGVCGPGLVFVGWCWEVAF